MPQPERIRPRDPAATTTVGLLYHEFGDVLIPLEAVRLRYFRNRNAETFKRALAGGEIPLPIVTLDDSHKSPRYICLYQLAAYIEQRSRDAADERETAYPFSHQARLNRALVDAVPITDFRPAEPATPRGTPWNSSTC